MAKLNMAKVNTLFRKGYLLAGVIMAANMFVVNEVKATEENKKEKEENEEDKKTIDLNAKDNTGQENNEKKNEKGKISGPQSFFNFLLSHENAINLIGGVVSSVANNYFKWWDYNAGSYCKLRIGCLGWRTKKFFDIVQLDFNLNLGRGISWSFLGVDNVIKGLKDENYAKPLYFSHLVARLFDCNGFMQPTAFIAVFLIQGFVSAPLIFHISNFSIAISLDSMLWAGIGFFLDKGKNNEEKGGIKTEEEELKEIDTKA